MAGVSIVSCDLKQEKNNMFLYTNETTSTRVKTNIEEAKVLSDVVRLNENVIQLAELALKKSETYKVRKISTELITEHLKIKEYLNHLAEKKIILLPGNFDNSDVVKLSGLDGDVFVKAYLNTVFDLAERETNQLEYLSKITNDVDFKVITVKALVRLNYNLNQIKKTIKTDY